MVTISLKKIISISPLSLFYFSIHRIKVGNKWGKFLIIVADNVGYKGWWIG
jgi:hypothetical protein